MSRRKAYKVKRESFILINRGKFQERKGREKEDKGSEPITSGDCAVLKNFVERGAGKIAMTLGFVSVREEK